MCIVITNAEPQDSAAQPVSRAYGYRENKDNRNVQLTASEAGEIEAQTQSRVREIILATQNRKARRRKSTFVHEVEYPAWGLLPFVTAAVVFLIVVVVIAIKPLHPDHSISHMRRRQPTATRPRYLPEMGFTGTRVLGYLHRTGARSGRGRWEGRGCRQHACVVVVLVEQLRSLAKEVLDVLDSCRRTSVGAKGRGTV